MITKQDLLEAIAECQGTRNPNANTAIKLAAFYTIYDHLYGNNDEQPKSENRGNSEPLNANVEYSFENKAGIIVYESETEFGKLIHGRDQTEVLSVMDELMSTIKMMNERLYDGVMNKLQ